MKKVLYVVDTLPPEKGGRVEKISRRIKYLARLGWHIDILAPEPPDELLDKESPISCDESSKVSIHRTSYLFKKRWSSLRHHKNRSLEIHQGPLARMLDMFFVPQGFIRWLPYAILHGIALARSSDVILTMNNPVMLHLVGYILKKITGRPWVAEFRDPLVGYAYSNRGPERLNRFLESLIVHNADRVIRLEDFVPESIAARYLQLPTDRFVTIPYVGYDIDDFDDFKEIKEPFNSTSLQICYTGSFYGDSITPVLFLKALNLFLSNVPEAKGYLAVRFAGDWSSRYSALVSELNLQDVVVHLGYLSRAECLSLWAQSHLLLLILGKEEDNIQRIPSKFWDYVATKRAILALVHPQGTVANLVRQQNLGFVADTENEMDIFQALCTAWNAFQNRQLHITKGETSFFDHAQCLHSETMISNTLSDVICNVI